VPPPTPISVDLTPHLRLRLIQENTLRGLTEYLVSLGLSKDEVRIAWWIVADSYNATHKIMDKKP
jgi:hypothetical protein